LIFFFQKNKCKSKVQVPIYKSVLSKPNPKCLFVNKLYVKSEEIGKMFRFLFQKNALLCQYYGQNSESEQNLFHYGGFSAVGVTEEVMAKFGE